jgi:TonB family protein
MKTSLIITVLMLTLTSAFAETDVIPLPDATKKQMQAQAENAAIKKQTPAKPEKVQDIKEAIALATYTPRPQYPYEARSRHVTGWGVILARVNLNTGLVTSVKMVRSTGSPILDYAALSAYRQWRFRPKIVTAVRFPFGFTMTGTQYLEQEREQELFLGRSANTSHN